MRRACGLSWSSFALMAFACGGANPAAPTTVAWLAPPVAVPTTAAISVPVTSAPPRGLRVEGNQFFTGNRAVRLLGVSHSGTESTCTDGRGEIFQGPSGDTLVPPMLGWKVNTVRVPLNESCWLGVDGLAPMSSGRAYREAIARFVRMLLSHDLFVVLDLHWNAPGLGVSRSQLPMADADHSPAFWTSVAEAFKNDPGVVFDLYNEPFIKTENADTADPWECWSHGCAIKPSTPGGEAWKSAGMQALVDAVRATGASNVILLGGLSYANDLSGWLAHMPRDPTGQLAASFHVYNFAWPCNSSRCWTTTLAAVAEKVPLLTGELGENDCEHGFIDAFMGWADHEGVSYLGWAWNTWDCRSGPSLISDYEGTPTGFGAGFKAHLAALPP
jgi:endoglucanase